MRDKEMLSIRGDQIWKKKEGIPWKELEGEGFVLDVDTGDYYEFDEIGLFIWKRLDQASDLNEVAAQVFNTYLAPRARILKDLLSFVGQLKASRLVEQVSSGKARK